MARPGCTTVNLARVIVIMMVSRERSSPPCVLFAVIAASGLTGAPRMAHADDVVSDEEPPPSAASSSVEAGAFLPSALSPRTEDRRGMVMIMGGWDQNRAGGIYDAAAEARLLGPVSLLAGATYDGPGTRASPHLELRLDAARQARHGLDMAAAAGYSDVGFNTVPIAVLKIAIGRNVGASYLLANAVYEHGLREEERSGELRLAALYPVARAVHVGLDARFQIDLERDDDEPTGESEWESRSGFVATYTWDRIVLTSGAGISALRLRAGGATEVGPVLTAGVGTVF
jgi:hypothetical protein